MSSRSRTSLKEIKTLLDLFVAAVGYLGGLPGTGDAASEQFAAAQ